MEPNDAPGRLALCGETKSRGGAMPPNEHNAVERWRLLALDAYAEAQDADADSRAILLHIAGAYERLAEKAEKALNTIVDAPQPLPEKE